MLSKYKFKQIRAQGFQGTRGSRRMLYIVWLNPYRWIFFHMGIIYSGYKAEVQGFEQTLWLRGESEQTLLYDNDSKTNILSTKKSNRKVLKSDDWNELILWRVTHICIFFVFKYFFALPAQQNRVNRFQWTSPGSEQKSRTQICLCHNFALCFAIGIQLVAM